MRAKDERGIVLVAALLVLAILSLLGAGSLIGAGYDTSAVGNKKTGRQVFYAAETALDAGVFKLAEDFRVNSTTQYGYSFEPTGSDESVTSGDHYVDGSDFNGYSLTYTIDNPPGAATPAPPLVEFSTMENNMQISNLSQTYELRASAEGVSTTDRGAVRESVRILSRPVTQYFAFFDGHMNFTPQNGTTLSIKGGRIYASGNIYMAPSAGATFEYDQDIGSNAITAGGSIVLNNAWYQNDAEGAAATGGNVIVEVPVVGNVEIDTDITSLTKGEEESRFAFNTTIGRTDAVVRSGVDMLRTVGIEVIARNGLYEDLADGDAGAGAVGAVDTFKIIDNGAGVINIDVRINGAVVAGAEADILDGDAATVWYGFWSGGAQRDANNTIPGYIPRTIVYSKEYQPTLDHLGNAYPSTCTGPGDVNYDYPAILEGQDPRETRNVDFLVIDLQRLQNWYDRYWVDTTGASPPGSRKVLIYAARAPGVNLPAVKLIGSESGRVRSVADPVGIPAATVMRPTTIASPNPVYVEGDFKVGGPNCVIIADAVTLLSNEWGNAHYGAPLFGAGVTTASDTRLNAAIIAGRYDYVTGGTGTIAEGVEDLVRKIENWDGVSLPFRGSLVSPWFSAEANSPFVSGMVTAPDYEFEYETGFSATTGDTVAPYIPLIHLVERESWREE